MDELDLTTPEGRLRWARIKAGFVTAADAARRCGVKEVTYSAHEAGRGTIPNLADYYRVFKVSLEWLMTGRGDPNDFIDEDERKVIGFMRRMDPRDRREYEQIGELKARKTSGDSEA
jgi:hypothetical protein